MRLNLSLNEDYEKIEKKKRHPHQEKIIVKNETLRQKTISQEDILTFSLRKFKVNIEEKKVINA